MSELPTAEFKSSVGLVMLRAPAGSFTMGSAESEDGHQVWEQQRQVTFVNDFYLGRAPVTQDQYKAVTGTNPTVHEQIGDAPVDSVNWNAATEYCRKLTQLDRESAILPPEQGNQGHGIGNARTKRPREKRMPKKAMRQSSNLPYHH